MGKQHKMLLKIAAWLSVVLFVVRCAFSWDGIVNNFSVYILWSNAGEAIGFAALLVVLYEKWIWRINPFEKTPKLHKKYTGIIKSSYDGSTREASLEIKQTLTSISVILITDESTSNSLMASIDSIMGEEQLTYCFLNRPNSVNREKSQIHFGTAIFSLRHPDKLVGQYYTDRKTIGDMEFAADVR